MHALATLVVVFSVGAPLLLFHLTRDTPLRYLFVRPAWAHLPKPAVQEQLAAPPSSCEHMPRSPSASRLPS
jgi:hypothetical protein